MNKPLSRTRRLLSNIDFGSDVAETDKSLADFFVNTSDYLDILADRYDVVLGPKGSGKTAIFKQLSNADVEIPQLRYVDVVPAFNVHGSIIFRELNHGTGGRIPSDREFSIIWLAYLAALLANHVSATYGETSNRAVDEVTELLRSGGILAEDPSPTGVFGAVLERVSHFLETTDVEANIGVDTGPVSAGAKISRKATAALLKPVDFERLFFACEAAYTSLRRRAWIVVDRLDEAFYDNPPLEAEVLRGLLRTKIDLNSFGDTLGIKLFLRSDVMDRVSGDRGFVNATHLRPISLHWSAESVTALIAKRLAKSENVRRGLAIRANELSTREGQRRVTARLIPSEISGRPAMSWLLDVTTDASGLPNPRNVVRLLGEARTLQLRHDDVADRSFRLGETRLITEDSWISGARELSRVRLQDTVLAEHPEVRPILDKLKGTAYRLTKAQLTELLGVEIDGPDADRQLSLLSYLGMLDEPFVGSFEVPTLYRHALNLSQSHVKTLLGVRLGTSEISELSADATERARRVLETKEGGETPPLHPEQRKFVHQFVQSNFEDLRTESGVAQSDGRKGVRIFLAPEHPRFSDGDPNANVPRRGVDEILDPEVLAAIHGLVATAVDSITKEGRSSYVGPKMLRHEADITAALSRELENPDGIRVIGMLVESSGAVRCVFGRDFVSPSMAEQDRASQSSSGSPELASLAESLREAVVRYRVRCESRPMSTRMAVKLIGALTDLDGVSVDLMPSHTPRVVVLPI
ncbi:MAG: hypothetical protein JWL72_897 [Ilumatobacteraceae bacterium]|nr:hypothetical protein [Ilumatobacteraceae bacterium]